MQIAKKTVPVYSSDGSRLIGELRVGDEALVLSRDEDGIVIAYILGLVKSEYTDYLKDASEWKESVSEIDKFLAYASSAIGCLYVWGAQGQKMTPELIKQLENSTKNYNWALAHYNTHAENGETLAAYDCSGLIVAYLLENGYISSDTTANGLYFNHCTDISKSDLRAGDMVFRKYAAKNKMYHVGIYMGDGSVVHAKGRDDGVVLEAIFETNWNRYGRLNVFAEEENTVLYTRALKNKGRPYMRGDDVRAVQTALTEQGYTPGSIDASYGPKTEKAVKAFQEDKALEVDGIVGPITWAALFE